MIRPDDPGAYRTPHRRRLVAELQAVEHSHGDEGEPTGGRLGALDERVAPSLRRVSGGVAGSMTMRSDPVVVHRKIVPCLRAQAVTEDSGALPFDRLSS